MEKGYYKEVEKTIHHEAVEGVEEKWHYEVAKEYPNGGKDVVRVVDVEGVSPKEAYDEVIKEKVWVDYTEEELTQLRIYELKELLTKSDYKAIKFAEGLYTEEEYEPIKEQRQAWRDEINRLEEMLSTDTK